MNVYSAERTWKYVIFSPDSSYVLLSSELLRCIKMVALALGSHCSFTKNKYVFKCIKLIKEYWRNWIGWRS